MFTTGLIPIARTWKKHTCPSMEEWIKKMWYIYTMHYYPAIRENQIMPFVATWMDPETFILSEVKSDSECQLS